MPADSGGVSEKRVLVQPEQPAALSAFHTSMPRGTHETHGAFIVSRDFMSSLST